MGLDKEYIRTGDKARAQFRFMYWPEYVKEGSRLIFREGRTKGIGRIIKIVPPEEEIGMGVKGGKKQRKREERERELQQQQQQQQQRKKDKEEES